MSNKPFDSAQAKPFDPVDPKQPLPDMERGILQYWHEEDVFKRSIRQRSQGSGDPWDGPAGDQGKVFSFYDGPPFATGLPHYGHLLAGTIKDVIPRYQTMRGKEVQRRFGWDCHGLPIENIIEQENNITDHKQITDEIGVDKFNEMCRDAVQRYTQEWRQVVERMGRWVDMDWDYRTMDPDYMESMWWAFKELYKKDMIYEGHKSMHICTRCVTPLSNFEVTQGYEDRTDMSVVMTFPLKDDPNTVILAWTTTPWSLAGNLWLLVGPEIEYVKVQSKEDGKTYILAKKLVEKVFKDHEHEVVGDITAKELEGLKYEPLFPYFVDTVIPSTEKAGKPETYGNKCFYVMMDEHGEVSDADGTGIVHITNSHGEDGFEITKKLGIDVLHHLNMDGSFKDACTDFRGLVAKPEGDDPMATDRKVIAVLKEKSRHFSSYTFTHSYPHCWRCDSPLLNYAASSWFVRVEGLKEKMLQNNAKTRWVPGHMRDGRYGNWLENARDWAISRNRFWGTPLPIWRCDQTDDIEVIGSRDELMKRNKVRFTKITLVRHGESEGNTIPVYQGVPPGTDLTKKGRKQAETTAKYLAGKERLAVSDKLKNLLATNRSQLPAKVDIIYCSPLARTRQTAEAIAKQTGAKIVVDERLKETQFGEFEGKTIDFNDLDLVKAKRAHKLQENSPESIYHFEGMETWADVKSRIESFLDEILPQHRSDHVVIVSHADPINSMRHYFTDEDPVKLSHQPYPRYCEPFTFFWDHKHNVQMDLHKHRTDDIIWSGEPSEKSVEVTLVRHGQTDWNVAKRSQGAEADNELNDTGRQQAVELADSLRDQQFDAIICSDLKRAKETAAILSSELSVEVTEELSDLRERYTGDWSGQDINKILDENPYLHHDAFSTTYHFQTPPNGESLNDLLERTERVRDTLLSDYAGKKVLLVSHGGTTRALMTVLQNLAYGEALTLHPKNAEMFKVELHQPFKRIPEVLDCWFESGSMPYSQSHFPFNTPELRFPPGFPADFIAEGVDQTRAWFYVLMVLSTALFGETPFKNVVVNGIVLAEDGKKMSKRLKNYPEPKEIVEKYGADAIRFTLMNSPAVRAEDLRISERIIEEGMRNVILPLWNTYAFFVTYANAADFTPGETRRHSVHPLDQWILTEVQDLVNRMTEQLDRYDLSATCSELFETIDGLTNWYVRLSRRRFAGKGTGDSAAEQAQMDRNQDQQDALHTLYDVLLTVSQVLAPFCPFVTDAIYLNLANDEHGSIHLTDWPQPRELSDDEKALLQKTRHMRNIVSLGNSIRGEKKIKNRQPLASATVAIPPALMEGSAFSNDDIRLLQSELNVKDLEFTTDPGELAEAYAQVDARKVGPRLGKRVQEVINAGKEGEFRVEDDGSVLVLDERLAADEVQIVYRGKEGQDVAADRGVVVSLETEITDELKTEGQARDLIRTVQRLRKESGLAFTDKIMLAVEGADDIMNAHGELIAHETKAVLSEVSGQEHEVELEDLKVKVNFEKV